MGLDGDGSADAAVWGAMDGWHVGLSDGKEFGKPYVQHVFTGGCTASSKDCIQRAVSEGLIWYITATETASVWHRYNVSAKGGQPRAIPAEKRDSCVVCETI